MYNPELIKKAFKLQTGEALYSLRQYENVPNNSVFNAKAKHRDYIFKIYSSSDWPEDCKLPFINRKLAEYNIPHARLIAFNREDENFPKGYSIEECLPGMAADRLDLSENEIAAMYEKLAVLVSRVHQIEMSNYGYIGEGIPAWAEFSTFMYDVLEDSAGYLIENGFITAPELSKVNNALCAALKGCDKFPPVLCHGDLSAKNILVNADEITLIDWDDAQALCWFADITRLTFWMRMNYNKEAASIYREVFLNHYETNYGKSIFYEIEDVLHVWYGFDYLTFFNKGPACENVKTLLWESRNKCGI